MFCSHVRYVCLYVCMYVCMHVCTKSFLKTTTNSSCVCTHLANKADSDSDSDSDKSESVTHRQHLGGQGLTVQLVKPGKGILRRPAGCKAYILNRHTSHRRR